LLNSWVMPSPRSVYVTFGKPVDLTAYYGKPLTRALIEEVKVVIMKHVRALQPNRRE